MRKLIFLIILYGCFSIEETIWIKDNENYDLLYKVQVSSFITQIIPEDSIRSNLNDERAKYIKVETDSLKGIVNIEIFYENLNLNELLSRDSSIKFFKGKNYIEFFKFLSLNDTLTKNLINFITDENYYKFVVISQKPILQSNADSISQNKVVWIFPLRKLYQLKVGDTIRIFFRIEN
ncbi:MAG: hypothetical protein ABIL89_02275 [candidate division WOR-3 bacterium]